MSCPSTGSVILASASRTADSVVIGSFPRSCPRACLRALGPSGERAGSGKVPQLGLLRSKIIGAVLRRADPVRLLRVDDHPGALEALDLARVVGHQAHRGDAEVGQDP